MNSEPTMGKIRSLDEPDPVQRYMQRARTRRRLVLLGVALALAAVLYWGFLR